MLQQVYIGKNGIVDALQHVVGSIANGFYSVGIIDESITQGADLSHLAFQQEMRQDVVEINGIHDLLFKEFRSDRSGGVLEC